MVDDALESGTPLKGVFSRQQRSGPRRQGPLRSPVREPHKFLEAPPQRRPLGMTSEVAPAASGRLSVANSLSTKSPCLIHHPSAVDCSASLTTGLQGNPRALDLAGSDELHAFRA